MTCCCFGRLQLEVPHTILEPCRHLPTVLAYILVTLRGVAASEPAGGAQPTVSSAAPRVLLVDSVGYEELAGASTVIDELIEGVDRQRFVPVLACLSEGRWPEQVRVRGTPAYSFPRTRLRSPGNVIDVATGLRSVVRSQAVTLIHASENSALLYAAIAGRLTHRPVLWHIHSPLRPRSREEKLAVRALRHLCPSHIVFTSTGARQRSVEFPGVPSSVISPGVDLVKCASGDRRRGRAALGVSEDALVATVVSRIEPMKGQTDFVEALGRLCAERSGIYGVMCGPADRHGPYWHRIEELCRRYELGEHLLMPGDVRSPLKEDVVAASDVIVHPSHAESFGLAVLEAMAAGKAVVAAATDGPRILMEDGVDGVMVPVGDVDALYHAMKRVLDDPELRAELGANAARAASKYPVEPMVRHFEDLWAEVLSPWQC